MADVDQLTVTFKRKDYSVNGALLLRKGDVDIEAVGSPAVKMTHTQTIMKGVMYCDFRFCTKTGAVSKRS
jgi:hypothetical protein